MGEHSYSNVTLSQVYPKATTLAKGKQRGLTQSQSVAGFTPFKINKREDDDLPQHIKGAACWSEVADKEGYFVFDTLSQSYLAVEYEANTRQWYFVCQDMQTRNWIATQPVPSTFNLGRQL